MSCLYRLLFHTLYLPKYELMFVEGQRIAPPGRIWNAVKDEPEDLTGRQTENKSHQELNDGIQRTVDSQTNAGDSASDSDSDLCIDEQVIRCFFFYTSYLAILRFFPIYKPYYLYYLTHLLKLINLFIIFLFEQQGGAGGRKRKKIALPPNIMSSVTPAELQKRPGLIPLTSNLAGPVQVMTAKDGAKLYSCPECNLFYADHLAFEIHLQGIIGNVFAIPIELFTHLLKIHNFMKVKKY